MNFLDRAMDAAIRRDIPTDDEFYRALGERTERGITSIFDSPAARKRRNARIARDLAEFLEEFPPHGKLRPGQR